MANPKNGTVLLVAVGLAVVCPFLEAQLAPQWWEQQGVLQAGPADDYALANVGQLKNLTAAAADALDAAGWGAGTELRGVVDEWRSSTASADDYAVLNEGQLKGVASVVYGRLLELGYIGVPLLPGQAYPWTSNTDDDDSHSAVNVGQLKFVFSFRIDESLLADVDADNDGMPDSWERAFGLVVGANDAALDKDGDGVPNREDADPARSGIGAVSVSISAPANGDTL